MALQTFPAEPEHTESLGLAGPGYHCKTLWGLPGKVREHIICRKDFDFLISSHMSRFYKKHRDFYVFIYIYIHVNQIECQKFNVR